MKSLNIASTVECTESEGIGKRFAIWTQGCNFKCPGCCNPHLWSSEGGQRVSVDELWEKIVAAKEKHHIEGITLVGGEALEQLDPVTELCKLAFDNGLSVIIFTGFLLEDVEKMNSPILSYIDVLIDGLYMEKLRTTTRRFIGSTNQRIHFLTNFYSADDMRWSEPNTAEIIFNDQNKIQVIGFPFDSILQSFGPKSSKDGSA